jgi:phosphocarrier protein HPr
LKHSTCFRNNIAIPHGYSSFVNESAIVFARLKQCIDWDKNGNKVNLINPSGLHARPAAQFTQTAGKFKDTKVKIVKDGHEIDAKSILGIMSLGLSCGTVITIQAEGPNEAMATTINLWHHISCVFLFNFR